MANFQSTSAKTSAKNELSSSSTVLVTEKEMLACHLPVFLKCMNHIQAILQFTFVCFNIYSSHSAFTFGVNAISFTRNDHQLPTTPCCWTWLESEHWRLLDSYLDFTNETHSSTYVFFDISLRLRQSGDQVNQVFVCALEKWIFKNWFNYTAITTIIKGICSWIPSISIFNTSLSSARPPPEFGPIVHHKVTLLKKKLLLG